MIETTNNIIFYLGYGVAIVILLFIIWVGLYFLYTLILKTPRLAIEIYKLQLKKHISGSTDESYNRFLKKIDKEYRNYKETKSTTTK